MDVEKLISLIFSSKPFDFIHYVKILRVWLDHSSLGNYSNVVDGDEFKVLSGLACPSHTCSLEQSCTGSYKSPVTFSFNLIKSLDSTVKGASD